MHIHRNSFNMQAAGLSAAQQQKAVETRRTADVRKTLLKGAASLACAADPQETMLIGEGENTQPGQGLSSFEPSDEYHSSTLDKDSDFR